MTTRTLTLTRKGDRVQDIIRKRLVNGNTSVAHLQRGTVSMATGPGAYRDLGQDEGSLTDGLGSAKNPGWTNTSLTTYNEYILNGDTGAKRLLLPIVTTGATTDNAEIAKRPQSGENTAHPTLFSERFFGKVSLRILLSDTRAGHHEAADGDVRPRRCRSRRLADTALPPAYGSIGRAIGRRSRGLQRLAPAAAAAQRCERHG